jgi:hypothetical protein
MDNYRYEDIEVSNRIKFNIYSNNKLILLISLLDDGKFEICLGPV